jgi:hypothetical protein
MVINGKSSLAGGYGVEAFEREQKWNFAECVRRQVIENHVNVIGEEINQDEITFAREIAEAQQCRYTNIDMPELQRRTAGIPRSRLSAASTALSSARSQDF